MVALGVVAGKERRWGVVALGVVAGKERLKLICEVGWYVWRPGGGVDGEKHVA